MTVYWLTKGVIALSEGRQKVVKWSSLDHICSIDCHEITVAPQQLNYLKVVRTIWQSRGCQDS